MKGYVLLPIYLATDKSTKIKGKYFSGMDRRLGKKLRGSIYYLKPQLFYKLLESFVQNLINQKFNKIIVVTGHGGSKQIEILKKLEQNYNKVIILNPYSDLKEVYGGHADVGELSLFWALYPEEVKNSLKRKISRNNDCFTYMGRDPREKSSLKLGRKILKQVMEGQLKKINIK